LRSGREWGGRSAAEMSRYRATVAIELFAGIPVGDYEQALVWYEQLLGSGPSFVPHATEAVWELAEHRWVFIEERPEDAGHAMHTIFVDDLDAVVEEIAARGIEPVERETYANGVRKETYRDPDGNEIGFGGGPVSARGADEAPYNRT
jgi:predicted enzyme related to lactoylglutathione lyase